MYKNKKEERGVFIQWSVFRNKETTLSEKVLFLEINNLSMLDRGCVASNRHFADTLGVKKESISRLISSLEKKGYITTEIVDGSRNYLRKITINKMLLSDNKMLIGDNKMLLKPITKCLETKENKTITNKTVNKTVNKRNIKENKFSWGNELDISLHSVFNDFLVMRKSIKKPATEQACKLIIKKLRGYPTEEQKRMIEQSIECSWAGVFDVKQPNNEKIKSFDEL